MKIIFPYVPNVRQIVGRVETLDHLRTSDADTSDAYSKFLIDLKAVVVKENCFIVVDPWRAMIGQDETKKLHIFQNIISDIKIYNDIVEEVSHQDQVYDSLISKFTSTYHEQDIRVVLSWLETLKIISQKDGLICIRLDESEYDDEQSDSIYPMNSDAEMNVREEKMSVFEYLRKIDRGLIVMNPDFQRHLVWKNSQKSMFIESAILNIPIPPIYLKRVEGNQMIVVDGLQRTNALISFFKEGLCMEGLNALTKLNGNTCKTMNEDKDLASYVTRIEDKQLFFYTLQQDIPMSVVYDIFNRINTGGTQLERQEIRNCIFIGKSTNLLKRISESSTFGQAIDYGISPKRMKDREAALRCIAFCILQRDAFKGSLDDFLELAMKKMNRMTDIEIDDIYKEFMSVMKCSLDIFGNTNFRIPTDYTRGRINIAVMETVFFCLKKLREEGKKINKGKIRVAFQQMLEDPDYLDSVRNSTGSKLSVNSRFDIAIRYLTN